MPKTYKRRVVKVVDGDTFDIDEPIDGISRIRLANVDTPELHEKYYKKYTQYLEKIILGKKVKLEIKSKNKKKGKYPARWVCHVYYGAFYAKNASEKVQKKLDKMPIWWKFGKKE